MSKSFLSKGLVLIAFMLTVSLFAFSQASKNVSGKVTGKNNEPLQGVTVTVKGTSKGTMTDSKGKYEITYPKGSDILVFSYIGYESQEIPITNESTINVSLKTSASALQGVVVVGFGTQSRAEVTTSISKLNNNVLKNIPYSNAASALEGTIPGLLVQSNSGQPGAEPRIILRGGTSINNPNGATPLYVIDGVIRSNMNNINPSDIKSIQVLKDAASTAIYGARGSNGVIIIETKSGQAGKTEINYRYDLTFSKVGKTYDLLQGRDFLYYARLGIAATAGLNPAFNSLLTGNTYAGGIGNDLTNKTFLSEQYLTPENQYKLNQGWESMPDPLDSSKTIIFSNTNYQDYLFRTAVSQNHAVSVSGGTDKATFHLGLGYLDAEGIAVQTDYKRASIDLSGNLKMNDNLSVFGRVMYSSTLDHQVPNISNIFAYGLIQPPTDKLYFEDGTLSPGRNLSYANPVYQLSTYNPKNTSTDLTLVVGANWNILPGLTFDPQISLYQRNVNNRNFQKAYWNGTNNFNTARTATGSYSLASSPQASAVLTYEKSINEVHNIQVKAGYSYFGQNNSTLSATGSDAATDLIPTLNASATPIGVSGTETHQNIFGYFSRVTYNYKEKYLFNASLRYDGASNLGESNKWGAFPGVSAGWRIDKEDFWNNIFPDRLLQLKLRGSYGVNGNISGLGTYQAQGEYSTSALYDGNAAVQLSVLPNQDLKWEQSKTVDVGMDIGVLNNRISVMLDYYRRVTDNLLTTLSMPPSTGFSSILTNYGSLENKGFEIELNADILPATSAFKWNVSFNTAIVNSKILKLPPNGIANDRVGGIYAWDEASKSYQWKGGLQEGGRIGDLYGYQQVSIFPTDAAAQAGPVDMLIPRANKTKYGGDVNWLDADHNDTIDTRDQVYMGNPYPTQTGGFSTLFSYKNLSLNVRMDYTLGATVYYELGARLEGNFSGSNAIGSEVLRSWKKQGDITDIPRYYWADQNAQWNVWNARGNSRFYEKTDFLCIREVTLAYTLPASWLKRMRISDFRLHLTGNNLHYFTSYDGLSPEESASTVAYPNPMNFIIGASITF